MARKHRLGAYWKFNGMLGTVTDQWFDDVLKDVVYNIKWDDSSRIMTGYCSQDLDPENGQLIVGNRKTLEALYGKIQKR